MQKQFLMGFNMSDKNNFKISDLDKEKCKMFFTMLGEVIAMFIGLFSIFKKNETNEENKKIL